MAITYGDRSIIERMHERKADKILPFEQDYHLSDAYDGGGISTISAIAAARVMADLDFLHRFESIATISAAIFAGATAITGQSLTTKEIFQKHIHDRGFIDYGRIFKWREPSPVNLHVVDETIRDLYPLDTAAIKASKTKLLLGLTNMTDYSPKLVVMQDLEEDEMLDNAMYGVHLPIAAGPPGVNKDGDVVADGGMIFPDTASVAYMYGADAVIEHSNNKHKIWKGGVLDRIGAVAVGLWMHRHVGSGNGFVNHWRFTVDQRKNMNNRQDNVFQIFPEHRWGKLPGTLCRKGDLIEYGWNVGEQTTLAAVGYDTEHFTPSPAARRSLQRFFGTGEPSRTFIPIAA